MIKYVILIPSFNDWECLNLLIPKIDHVLKNTNENVDVLIVNDGSTKKNNLVFKNMLHLKKIEVLNLRNNVKAQIAIATGLNFLKKEKFQGGIIVMDGDGEDRPVELNSFYQKLKLDSSKTITADRLKRTEGNTFKILYNLHKFITWIFTGKLINFGNYSCLPRYHVENLIKQGSLWNSFSGTVAKTIDKRIGIKTNKGKRYYEPSQLSYLNTFIHSFTISSVFKKKVTIRTILFCVFFLFIIINFYYFLFFLFHHFLKNILLQGQIF